MKSTQLFNYYKKLIHKNIKNDYLSANLEKPVVEEYKLFALDTITSQHLQKDNYIVSTMVVQMALNTHDQIFKTFPKSDNQIMKKQQLTVLAGDFYSGIYYHLLAKAKDISFVRILAKGINELTQQKAYVYYRDFEHSETFLAEYEKIETALLNKVAAYFKMEQGIDYLDKWIMYKKLKLEWSKFQNSETTFFHQLLLQNVIRDNSMISLEDVLLTMLNQTKKSIKNYHGELPPQFDVLKQDFQQEMRKNNFLHINSVLEEGLSK
ncbi:heptaprenyl diphosphate synthase [Gracilibacillus ureilyticus]|uniref:Heptaprenyl diphosphate synthase n=1 Tax=Gracilibacillus ureilyticus TaxID=531814 RepID=A0A1H9LPH4_9BACI|nr:heptaprenyl diphosphate synthase component 1 [Gracilibacillus ureilyticus]SER13412.1 heptaprenyl diphosphate synthase [Gracilibacillus ureilyticus]